ncbi:MAG TPA: response regulator, partial [Bacteroidales bacterium]
MKEKKDLHILMLEDDPLDADLNRAQLNLLDEYNCIVKLVSDRDSYLEALKSQPDIILSDYSLPQYNGLEALNDLKNRKLLIPFIFVTGTINEETAADTIKSGAWDYVVKDRLFRLPLAIRSVLKLKEEKINTLKAEILNRKL